MLRPHSLTNWGRAAEKTLSYAVRLCSWTSSGFVTWRKQRKWVEMKMQMRRMFAGHWGYWRLKHSGIFSSSKWSWQEFKFLSKTTLDIHVWRKKCRRKFNCASVAWRTHERGCYCSNQLGIIIPWGLHEVLRGLRQHLLDPTCVLVHPFLLLPTRGSIYRIRAHTTKQLHQYTYSDDIAESTLA